MAIGNPFRKPGDEELEKWNKPAWPDSSRPKGPADSALSSNGGGGYGKAARDTVEARQRAAADKQAEDEPPPEVDNYGTPAKSDSAEERPQSVLSDPKWTENDTLFQQEAEVSVKVTLPEGKEHLTRVQAELFAKTPKGPESIAKAEGHADADGRATIVLPVYKPQGHKEGVVEYFIEFVHKLGKSLSTENLLRKVSETALKSADHVLVPGISFAQDSSFIRPQAAEGFRNVESKLKEWDQKNPKQAKIVVFGHADSNEKNAKALSERRAQSAYAFITNDAATWEKLYGIEKWGLSTLQILLKDLGHYHGTPDGQDGPKTQEAFKAIQNKATIPATGKEDAATRMAIFAAYMKGKHDIKIDASRFRQVASNPWMGCASNNRAKEGEEVTPENRRVAFILIKESKFFPVHFPCQDGSEVACQGQCKKVGKRSGPGIQCLFYDELVRERQQQEAKVEPDDPVANQEITEDFAIFASTVYGEAAASSEMAWRSVGHTIMNRIGKLEWRQFSSASAVIRSGGFDAYTHQNDPYKKCYGYIKGKRDGSDKRIERLITVLTPVYQTKEKDNTNGCVLYYSPKAQAEWHITNPAMYSEKPHWKFNLLEEVEINGLLPSDDFKFFKYKN